MRDRFSAIRHTHNTHSRSSRYRTSFDAADSTGTGVDPTSTSPVRFQPWFIGAFTAILIIAIPGLVSWMFSVERRVEHNLVTTGQTVEANGTNRIDRLERDVDGLYRPGRSPLFEFDHENIGCQSVQDQFLEHVRNHNIHYRRTGINSVKK